MADEKLNPEETEEVAASEEEATSEAIWDDLTDERSDEEKAAAAQEAASEEPAATEGEEEEEAAGEEPAAQSDIWANAPDELRAAFEAERQRAAAAEHARLSAEGRLRALQRPEDGVTGQQQRQPASSQQAAPPLTNEQIAAYRQWQADYPEVAEPIVPVIEVLNRQITEMRAENDRLRAGVDQIGQERAATQYQAAEAQVLEAHPDMRELLQEPGFQPWLDAQPQFVKAVYDVNAEEIVDPDSVKMFFDLYKQGTGRGNAAETAGQGQQSRSQQADDPRRAAQKRSAAGAPKPSQGAALRGGQADDEDPEAIWASLTKDDEAQGRRTAAFH